MLIFCSTAEAITLPELITEALKTHPSVQMQERQVDVARMDQQIALQQFWPTPSVSLERVNPSAGDVSYQGDRQLQIYRLQQPVWTSGRLSAGLDKSQASIEVNMASWADARLQLALKVIQTWGEWLLYSRKAQVVQESLLSLEQLDALLKRRIQEGASAPTEGILTESRLQQTRAQWESMQSQAVLARSRLAQLIGRRLTSQDAPAGLASYRPEPLASLLDTAPNHYPAYQRSQAQLRLLEAEWQERRADLFPEVYLRLEHQRGNFNYAGIDAVNRVFLGMSTRLGAGVSTGLQLEAIDKKREVIRAEMDNTMRTLQEQVETEWIQFNAAQARLPSLEKSWLAAEQTAKAWDRQFLAGRKSWMELMNTVRELMQAHLDLVDAQALLSVSSWRLACLAESTELAVQKMQETGALRP